MKLNPTPLSLMCAGLVIAAAVCPQVRAAEAFDGRWSVLIVPTSGECVARRTVPIQVSNGRIIYDGKFRSQASGKVGRKGSINVRFTHKGDVVDAQGALTRGSGRGSWASPTKKCSGT